jgi:hypothetical protein
MEAAQANITHNTTIPITKIALASWFDLKAVGKGALPESSITTIPKAMLFPVAPMRQRRDTPTRRTKRYKGRTR